MKQIREILAWRNNQKMLFVMFIIMITIPNYCLFVTEFTPILSKICNIIFPVSAFWFLMTLTKKPGKMLLILTIFVLLDAVQMVLLYLFGEAVIAVDMYLNLVTTNVGEAHELLGNLIPALVSAAITYGLVFALAVHSLRNKKELPIEFRKRQRKYSLIGVGVGVVLMGVCYITNADFSVRDDIYPVNVCYNLGVAIDRSGKTIRYWEKSNNFKFNTVATRDKNEKELYVLVIGETARADNFGIYGYSRNTTPELQKISDLFAFTDVVSQSNTTHKSVPMILSAVSAENYDSIYHQKGIISAYNEVGYSTAFFSNQQPNHSFIDFFGEEADQHVFVREKMNVEQNSSDDVLLKLVKEDLDTNKRNKIFIVLHTYGSHYNYQDRYPHKNAKFEPDEVTSIRYKYKKELVNAYDNSIRYTDDFLSRLIAMVDGKQHTSAAVLYVSDHGEDLYDDDRRMILHASPVPSYYQLHVPFLIWTSKEYEQKYADKLAALKMNLHKPVASNLVVFHTLLDMSGLQTPYFKAIHSLASMKYVPTTRYYLNDHNMAKNLNKIGLKEEDEKLFAKHRMRYP